MVLGGILGDISRILGGSGGPGQPSLRANSENVPYTIRRAPDSETGSPPTANGQPVWQFRDQGGWTHLTGSRIGVTAR